MILKLPELISMDQAAMIEFSGGRVMKVMIDP
jgi:hypothetical protein